MGISTILFGSVIFLILALITYFKLAYRFWKRRGFPQASPTIPWGNIYGANFKKCIGEAISELYTKFSDNRFIGIYLFNKPALLVNDPELIKAVFVKDFMHFHDRGIAFNEERDPLLAHLILIGGTRWRNLRVRLTPIFTSGKMKYMFPIMVDCSKMFSKVLQEPAIKGEVIEVKEYAARFTTDIISSAAFGLETDSLNNPQSKFRTYGQKVFEPTGLQTLMNVISAFFPSLADILKLKQIPIEIEEFFLGALKDTLNYRKKNNVKRNDFWELMIQLMDKGYVEDVDGEKEKEKENVEHKKITFLEAAAQAFVFFAAGFETSSTTMQFALYELAKNPEIQTKAREEVHRVLKKYNGEITYECVMELSYLTRIIEETLRMYCPIPFLQRECNKDYPIPDTDLIVPKGTAMIIPCWAIQRSEKYYPDPLKFNPDNFKEEAKASRHNYVYLPFGEGPRNCIGMRFGLLQTKVGLLTLLNKYEFSVASTTPIPIKYEPKSFIVSPVGGMNLKITEYK